MRAYSLYHYVQLLCFCFGTWTLDDMVVLRLLA